MADTVPMLSPDGKMGDIPADSVQAALGKGFKLGVDLVAPNGKTGMVPMDRVHDAINAGFRLQGAAPKGPAAPDMQEHNVLEDPNTVGKPSQGITPAGKLSGLPGVNPHEPGFREGVSDVMLAGTPLAALGTPAGVVKGVIGSTVGSQVARKGAQMLGAGPTTTDLAEVGGGLAGGVASQAELPNVGAKAKALAAVAAKDAASHVPIAGRLVRRPSVADYVDAARTQAPQPAAPPTLAELRDIKNANPTPENIAAWWKARGGKFEGEQMPTRPMTGEVTHRNPLPEPAPAPNDQVTPNVTVLRTKPIPQAPVDPVKALQQAQALRGPTNDVVEAALPDASKFVKAKTQAAVNQALSKGDIEGAQAALDKATGKKSDFPPPAPTNPGTTNDIRANLPETQARRFADTRNDAAVSQEMNWDLQRHGFMAESEARKEFIARNSTGTTKGDLVRAAGGTVPEQPVKYTKNKIPKSPTASQDLTDILQQSLDAAKKRKQAGK